ncbi:MAG TPA: prepilin-type N-terminal cleavage/methylation domain-containing protein [Steroidobacteraceae bacterium]|nr:prepilin-type N-terminal cleavage/methylation domain-containing protein [Steroidobacteraceae bacterium]
MPATRHFRGPRAATLLRLCTAIGRAGRLVLRAHPAAQRGFTLLELMFAIVVLGVLSTAGVAGYQRYVARAQTARAVADISEIQLAVDKFELNNGGALPASLADVGYGGQLDPWGNAYQYLNFANIMGVGEVRKDRNLVPINTDFDLYSVGPDGNSQPPLTATPSRDDIVRANDGRFIGKAEDY